MRRSLAFRFAAASLLVSLGLLAGPAAAQTEAGDIQEFCQARLTLQEALLTEDEALINDALSALVDAAPAPVLEAAQTIQAIVASGDDEAIESDESQQAQETIDSFVIANCGFRVAPVTGSDYAFEGVPKVFEAGVVAFQFSNVAEDEDHELLIFRIKDGVKASARKLLKMGDKADGKVEFAGAAFAEPGATDVSIVDLEPGRYLLVCMIPVGGKEDGKPHWKRGMYASFKVTNA